MNDYFMKKIKKIIKSLLIFALKENRKVFFVLKKTEKYLTKENTNGTIKKKRGVYGEKDIHYHIIVFLRFCTGL